MPRLYHPKWLPKKLKWKVEPDNRVYKLQAALNTWIQFLRQKEFKTLRLKEDL